MNDMQSEANTNAVDSLINYETVKYFNQEEFEVNRYDRTMSRWENLATKSFTSMTALNFVQGSVIAIGVGLLVFDQKPVKDAHAAGSLRIYGRIAGPGEYLNWIEFTHAGNGKFFVGVLR